MTCSAFSRSLLRRSAIVGCAIGLLCGAAAVQAVAARSGPFADFPGRWSGGGIIRVKGQDTNTTERMRCSATYSSRGSHDVELELNCQSDNYRFDLSGSFRADSSNRISGRWSERTRGVGGTVSGRASGNTLQIQAESPSLNANLAMRTRSGRQGVSLNAVGGGQHVSATISLRRQ